MLVFVVRLTTYFILGSQSLDSLRFKIVSLYVQVYFLHNFLTIGLIIVPNDLCKV